MMEAWVSLNRLQRYMNLDSICWTHYYCTSQLSGTTHTLLRCMFTCQSCNKHIYLVPRNWIALWLLIIMCYSNTLTYLLPFSGCFSYESQSASCPLICSSTCSSSSCQAKRKLFISTLTTFCYVFLEPVSLLSEVVVKKMQIFVMFWGHV